MKNIRKAVLTDLPALIRIRNDAHASKIAHGDAVWGKAGDGFSETWVKDHLARKDVYVAELDGIPVASVTLDLSDAARWGTDEAVAVYVHGLCVRHGYTGRGLGAFVLEWCAHVAIDLNRPFVRLDCAAGNQKLCAYYEALGFTRMGFGKDNCAWSLYEKPARSEPTTF